MTADRSGRPARTLALIAVDLVIFTIRDGDLCVLLIERGTTPHLGQRALPGGFARGDETLDEAAARELYEETGISGSRLHLEQLRTYGNPGRDPRGRVVTTAYLALGASLPSPVAATDARAAEWAPVARLLAQNAALAFDHAAILQDALERARFELEHTTVAAAFCEEPFTVGDLRQVYEAVWGQQLDPSNFRRRITRAEHFLEETGTQRVPGVGRPAALYRRGPAARLVPPLLRSQDKPPRTAKTT